MNPPVVSARALSVWQRNRDVFRTVWRAELPFTVIEPVFALSVMGMGLGGYVAFGGSTYLEFLAPGVIAAYAMWASGGDSSWGVYVRMTQQKTFDAIIATPVGIEDVITGEVLWGATRAVITSMSVMAAALVFGLVPSPWALLIPGAALLAGLLFSSIAVSFVALSPSAYTLNYFFSLFLGPMFFFCNVFFPLSGLPAWAQTVAWFLPLTHAVAIVRALFSGTWDPALLIDLAWILIAIAVFFTLAQNFMRRRLIV